MATAKWRSAAALALIALAGACMGESPVSAPEDPIDQPGNPSGPGEAPSFEGAVVVLVGPDAGLAAEGTLGCVYITIEPPFEDLRFRIGLLIWPNTTILVRRPNGSLVPGDLSDLVKGARVRAWTDELGYNTMPRQYETLRIEIG